jgi:NAD(P)H-flavin reductase
LYGARAPEDILYRRELERWRARFGIDVQVAVDHADAGWRGHVGWITALMPRCGFDPSRAAAFVCGPEPMMRSTARALEARGMPSNSIFVSMERNMKCAVGFCGHCLFGPAFICKDGPVFPYDRVRDSMSIREL